MDPALEKRLKRQIIGKTHRFLAVMPLGFEQTLISEFKAIGIVVADEQAGTAEDYRIVGDGKVEFTSKITEAWKAVAYSRIVNRVLMHIAEFKAENFREFEKKASEVPWELYLENRRETRDERRETRDEKRETRDERANIHVTCKQSRLYHSDAIAERLQKVIELSFSKGGRFPLASVSPGNANRTAEEPVEPSATPSAGTPRNAPSHNVYVNFIDDRCTLWLDLAGEELYKRGHERYVNDAPLKETIAAAMLFEATHLNNKQSISLDPSTPTLRASAQDDITPITLFDLMAGSGTFSLEAAYIANKLIPGICRDFALKHQPAFKEATWNYILRRENSSSVIAQNAESKILNIVTSDISERAIAIIKHNVESGPLASISAAPIAPQFHDFFSYTAKEIAEACGDTAPVIVLNPPYGKRLDFDAPKLYTKIGRKLTELAHDLKPQGKTLTVAILAPKDDTRDGAKYTCTANLLRKCPALSPENNPAAKLIVTSHGGLTLNTFIAKI